MKGKDQFKRAHLKGFQNNSLVSIQEEKNDTLLIEAELILESAELLGLSMNGDKEASKKEILGRLVEGAL